MESQQQTDNSYEHKGLKKLDAPVEVVLVDPLTLPAARLFARLGIHPLIITAVAFLARISGAVAFVIGDLKVGAACSILGFYLDGIDGKVARLRQIDVELHGTTDFLLDQIGFGCLAIGATIWSLDDSSKSTTVLIVSWLAVYMILMSFTSTWFRILSQHGIQFRDGTARSVFDAAMGNDQGGAARTVLINIRNAFMFGRAKLARFRMVPYFGAIESEVMVFMLAPFFGFNRVIVALGILFLLPDILIYGGMNVLTITRNRASNSGVRADSLERQRTSSSS